MLPSMRIMREDVEASLLTFNTVRQVEFLNNHGTVLERYQPGSETPEQLASTVHRVRVRLELLGVSGSW